MKPPIRLTPELQNQIVASIRAGGYPHVAALAWGVPRWLFKRWLDKGRRARARAPYRAFARLVDQARGQARLKAEIGTLEADPRFWLKHGPGREQPSSPGWSAMVPAAREPTPASEEDLLANGEVLQVLAKVRAALATFPEALAAVSAAFDEPHP